MNNILQGPVGAFSGPWRELESSLCRACGDSSELQKFARETIALIKNDPQVACATLLELSGKMETPRAAGFCTTLYGVAIFALATKRSGVIL